mmetsp:Transcript_115840/g.230942  ORF Transcript_115840/g.230942 Transcript_115840/m.230942 type:complete len:263 (-) Transcript_115840:753-1541(-)
MPLEVAQATDSPKTLILTAAFSCSVRMDTTSSPSEVMWRTVLASAIRSLSKSSVETSAPVRLAFSSGSSRARSSWRSMVLLAPAAEVSDIPSQLTLSSINSSRTLRSAICWELTAPSVVLSSFSRREMTSDSVPSSAHSARQDLPASLLEGAEFRVCAWQLSRDDAEASSASMRTRKLVISFRSCSKLLSCGAFSSFSRLAKSTRVLNAPSSAFCTCCSWRSSRTNWLVSSMRLSSFLFVSSLGPRSRSSCVSFADSATSIR